MAEHEKLPSEPPVWGGDPSLPPRPADRSKGWDDLASVMIHRPDSYETETNAAVHFFPVMKGDETLGYLWASVSDDAATYLERRDAGADGWNAGVPWIRRLRQAKAEGLTALEALRRWVGAPEDPRAGGIPADAIEQELPSLQALRELAASD